MPISLNQHRSSTGNYQNTFNEKNREHVLHKKNVNKNVSDSQASMHNTIPLINQTQNSSGIFNIQKNPLHFRNNAVTTTLQLMLLLNYIRPTEMATTRDIVLSETSNNLNYTAINDTLPEQEIFKSDVIDTYSKKHKKMESSNKIEKSVPVDTIMTKTYGLQNELFIKAVEALIEGHKDALIYNNKIKKDKFDDIFIKNKTTPNYDEYQEKNHVKRSIARVILGGYHNRGYPNKIDVEYLESVTCVENESEKITVGKVLRKIGDTIINPITEISLQAQLVYDYKIYGLCSSKKEDVEEIKRTTLFIDQVISSVMALVPIPQVQAIVLVRNIAGPFFRMTADVMEGEKINEDNLNDLIVQPSMLARLIVDSSPKDSNGIVITDKISLPENFIIRNNKNYIKMGSREWEIQYNEGKYTIKKNNIEREVFYSPEKKKWQYSIKGKELKLEREKTLFGKNKVYNIRKTENLLLQLSIKNGEHKKINEIKNYDLYHTKTSDDKSFASIKIDGEFIPMKSKSKKSGGYEVYDYKKPDKAGYPIYLGEDKKWHFGAPPVLLMKGDPTLPSYENVSENLYQSIPHTHYEDINLHDCQPINSNGIVKFKNGENYLKIDDRYIRVIKKENSHNIFELGSEQYKKILCYFNKDKNKFYTLEEKETNMEIVENDHREEDYTYVDGARARNDINVNKEDLFTELKTQFKSQKNLMTYREGFRGKDFREYIMINLADRAVNEVISEIYFYGLDKKEISRNVEYKKIAKDIKRDVDYSKEIVGNVKNILLNSEKKSYVTAFMRKLRITDNNGELSDYIKEMLIDKISNTNAALKEHIADDYKRIWLVDHNTKGSYGFTSPSDPLKRIYINLKNSDAFIKEDTKYIFCNIFCTVPPEFGDIKTIIHEASHIGSETIDSFYIPPKVTLEDEIARLSSGDMSDEEIEDIIKTRAAPATYPPLESDADRAKRIFNDYPDVRGEFLLKNADSLTQIILDLHNGAPKMNKRNTQSQQHINAEMLYLFVAQGLSERKHGL
ncbi:hypothetical protein [Pectobacterium carotovorum]|uniref:Uncharacterized protein n=1 Tax=Pectobacterium carotovorum TaxID=554 RepID=A0A419ASC5_PECCA|nr:hypothetical protein [Pectobacterium carotovorum]RJL48646.1 hypothetical protein D5071_17825 [Pectobacterium carotovorum]